MKKLETMTAEQLQSAPYSPVPFLVDELLPEGLHILAGAPKIGKSWLALWLCLCVSQGQPLWNFAVTQGEVLYLSLEDSYRRIQSRLFDLTEDAPPTLHFAIMADTLKHGLEQQIEQFLTEYPATKLVVIDTLQRVRSTGGDSNLYANDYQDVGLLKQLADRHHIAVLLIHHLRKLHDDDPMNMISGSTGLSGAADSAFVLQKNARSANAASLHCTGRDIPDRTLKLELGEEDHVWKLLADSKTCTGASKISALQLVHLFSALLSADPEYTGTPSALSAKIDPDGRLGTLNTLKLLFLGYFIGVSLGLVTSIACGYSKRARYWLDPIIKFLGPIPTSTWIPIIMVVASSLFGGAVVIITLGSWFAVTVASPTGICLTGGLCEARVLVDALSAALKRPVLTGPDGRYAGAIGAALLAGNAPV